jgi:3-hydroxyisobutyrate dehydrogenase-like beta-hydroxyacid dehydrogenase
MSSGTVSKIAFIGLGIMGRPMAANLVRAGFDVIGFNRGTEAVAALIEAGGRGAASIAEAVDNADVIATMVPDSTDVELVLAGPGGVFDNAAEVAREAGVAIPLGAQVAGLIASLDAQGHGGLDYSALLRTVEELSGRGAASSTV